VPTAKRKRNKRQFRPQVNWWFFSRAEKAKKRFGKKRVFLFEHKLSFLVSTQLPIEIEQRGISGAEIPATIVQL
jgi:hypothetical protein